jgi:hypothetical protein
LDASFLSSRGRNEPNFMIPSIEEKSIRESKMASAHV